MASAVEQSKSVQSDEQIESKSKSKPKEGKDRSKEARRKKRRCHIERMMNLMLCSEGFFKRLVEYIVTLLAVVVFSS
ncbi:hypothetical protein RND81_14G200300 [Saponaria officinalis]